MIELRVAGGLAAAGALGAIKQIAWDHPGGHALRLVIATSTGERRLTLGPEWGYSGEPACMAALAEFGTEPPRWVAN
jgi:hypothetical protein